MMSVKDGFPGSGIFLYICVGVRIYSTDSFKLLGNSKSVRGTEHVRNSLGQGVRRPTSVLSSATDSLCAFSKYPHFLGPHLPYCKDHGEGHSL